MSVYIKGMEMPQTGVYEIAVDNTWGKDKTVMTLYTRKDNGMLHVFGSYELVPVPPHGRLIDADFLFAEYDKIHVGKPGGARLLIANAPTIIQADPAKEGEG